MVASSGEGKGRASATSWKLFDFLAPRRARASPCCPRQATEGYASGQVHQLLVFGVGVRRRHDQLRGRRRHAAVVSDPDLARRALGSANATSTVALWPGIARQRLGLPPRAARGRPQPVGAGRAEPRRRPRSARCCCSRTPTEVFDRLVPLLILFATCLFMAQEPIQRRFDLSAIHTNARSHWLSWAMLFQAGVGALRRLLRRRHRHPDAGRAEPDGPHRHPPDERGQERCWRCASTASPPPTSSLSGLVRLAGRRGDGGRRDRRRRGRRRRWRGAGPHRRAPHRHRHRLRDGAGAAVCA